MANGTKIGLTDLMKAVTNPDTIPEMVVTTMPGMAQALGLLPLAGRLSLAATLLSLDVQTLLTRAIMRRSDLTPEEIEHLAARQRQICDETERLFRYGQTGADKGKIAACFGAVAPASPRSEPAAPDGKTVARPGESLESREPMGKA